MAIAPLPTAQKQSSPLELYHAITKTESNWLLEAVRALKTVYHEQGMGWALTKGGIASFMTGYTTLSSVWEEMGVGYSVNEMQAQNVTIARQYGDIGGWSPLALLDCGALYFFLNSNIAECNYLGVKRLCEEFLKNNLVEPDQAYEVIYKHLTSLNANCLFQKNIASRILLALEIVGTPTDAQKNQYPSSQWVLDASLHTELSHINSAIQNKCCLWRYFHRIFEGQKAAFQNKGIGGNLTSFVLGGLVPLAFTAASVLSLMGEYKLGQQVIGEKNDLPANGHLGEWLSNVAANMAAASYSHHKFFMAPGDVELIENIFKEILKSDNMQKNAPLYERLCDIAIQELTERNSPRNNTFYELKLQRMNPL